MFKAGKYNGDKYKQNKGQRFTKRIQRLIPRSTIVLYFDALSTEKQYPEAAPRVASWGDIPFEHQEMR